MNEFVKSRFVSFFSIGSSVYTTKAENSCSCIEAVNHLSRFKLENYSKSFQSL